MCAIFAAIGLMMIVRCKYQIGLISAVSLKIGGVMTQAREYKTLPKQCKTCMNLRRIADSTMFSCTTANRWVTKSRNCHVVRRNGEGQIESRRILIRQLEREIKEIKDEIDKRKRL